MVNKIHKQHYNNKCKEIEISRRRSHEHLPSRTFTRLFTLSYKRQDKAGDCVNEVQTVLYEEAVYFYFIYLFKQKKTIIFVYRNLSTVLHRTVPRVKNFN